MTLASHCGVSLNEESSDSVKTDENDPSVQQGLAMNTLLFYELCYLS